MADVETEQGASIEDAALAIDALLNPKTTEEAPAQAAPVAEQDSPQAEAQVVPDAGNAAVEGAAVPDAEIAAPVPTPAAETKPVSSPELDARLQEASRKAQEAENARNQFVNTLTPLVQQLEAQIKGQFADLKTEEDIAALMDPASPTYNPDRFNALQAHKYRLDVARLRIQAVQEDEARERQAKLQQWKLDEQKKLFTLIPDLKDPDKGPVLRGKLEAFAAKSGYTAQQLAMASANDFALLHRAMRADDLEGELAQAKAKAANAPPVQKPGTARPNANKDDKVHADFEQLKKSGRTDDAARVFANLLN